MSKTFADLNQRLSSLRRVIRARAGSVLILVVALIVILALLGTAFVATARIDRFTPAAVSPINAQLTQLQNTICTDIANGLFDQNQNYRPVANDPTIQGGGVTTPTYGHFDTNRWYPGNTTAVPPVAADPNEWDTWLADRLPVTFTDAASNTNIVWRAISRLPGASFSSLIPQATTTPGQTLTQVIYDPWGKNPPDAPTYLIPTAIAVTYPRSASESTPATPKVYPAFQMENAAGTPIAACGPNSTYPGPIIAADADGDGIPDSLLFPLNVTSNSSAGTVTYFAAVRIVDNNSAVNLNTAWSRLSDYQIPTAPGNTVTPGNNTLTAVDALNNTSGSSTWPTAGAGAANLGWLPSHVGLLQMLDPNETQTPAQEIAQLNSIRFGFGAISQTPYDDGAATGRTDYKYLTLGDALWNQLGRRIQNPGYYNTGAAQRYQSVNDNGELAFRFNLIDPSANLYPQTTSALAVAQSAPTVPEQALNYSLYIDAINFTQYPTYNRWSVYPADKALYWFDYNFNNNTATNTNLTNNTTGAEGHDNEAANASNLTAAFFRNPRAVTISRNPLSNAAPIHSFYGVAGAAPTNNPVGRQVPVPPPVAPTVPLASFMDVYPTAPKIPIRASINTDDFGTLWRAFWNVMCDDLNPGPNAAGATGLPSDHTTSASTGAAYTSMSQIYTPPVNIAAAGKTPLTAPITTSVMKWSQYDQLLIRAAIAAVNAEGLRDPDRNTVISRCIVLPDGVTVEVFSNKYQPYIIAYDQTGAGSGKPTITLGNPTNTAISLKNWVFAYYAAGDASQTTPPTPSVPLALNPTVALSSIGANSILQVQFDPADPINQKAFPASPPSPQPTDQILFMRPRLASGVPLISPNPIDSFNEGTAGNGLWDYVPLDYVLFTQSFITGRGTTGGTLQNWTAVQALLAPAGGPLGVPVNNLPNQIFNDDFPGPYAPGTTSNTSTTTSGFPFGAFSRLGDLLKVPFIGSYRVIVPTGLNMTTDVGYGLPAQVITPQVFASGTPPANTAVYFVPISMDAAACYTGTQDEQVGHFCPVSVDPTAPAAAGTHDYDWAKKLFDYFTVIQNPGNDFSPNVNPGFNDMTLGITANWSSTLYGTPPTWPSPTVSTLVKNTPQNDTIIGVTAVANTTATIGSPNGTNNNPNDEDNVGVDGLININTAPWQVLASLPMVAAGTADSSHVYSEANIALAHAIVLWRDGDGTTTHLPHGPFKSVFDLNNVIDQVGGTTNGFQNGWGTLFTTAASFQTFDSTPAQGDFSPAPPIGTATAPPSDNVPADFEKKFLTLARISNLITTRSDTFTCYVVVQGWLNAYTANPTLVLQGRSAFIANRVAVGIYGQQATPTNLSAPP